MNSIYFEGCVPVRTLPVFSQHELAETYLKKRIKPVGRADRGNIKTAFALLSECHPAVDSSVFDAEHLEEFQRFLITKKNTKGEFYDRSHINKLAGFVKGVYNWCARKKLVTYARAAELKFVPALEDGDANKENPEREAAKVEDILAVLPYLPPQIADMLLLLALTGLRPSEVCKLTVGEIKQDYDGELWLYLPNQHKTKRKKKKRALLLGDEEQSILKKYLTGKTADQPLFCNLQKRKERAITPETLGRILKDAIEKHNLGKFVPYQVRHTKCTWVSEVLDSDHARAQLGHSSVFMTARYDHSEVKKQKAVLQKRKEVGCAISRYVRGNFDNFPVKTHPVSRIFTEE